TPTQSQVDRSAASQLKKTVDKITPALTVARGGHSVFPNKNAGFGVQGQNVGVNEFIPSIINVKAGQKVTWTFVGFHTVSFGAPADVGSDVTVAADGSVNFNPKAFAPSGGPPAAAGKVTDAGSYDGKSFKSSGAGDS